MKKILGTILALSTVVAMLAGCAQPSTPTTEKGNPAGEKAKPIEIKFSSAQGEKDTYSMAVAELAKQIAEKSNGEIVTDVFYSGSLGSVDDLTEQAMQGAALVAGTDPSRLASFVSDFGIIQMPYLFEDYTFLDKMVETELYKQWETEFEAKGIKLVASNWYSGIRNFMTHKPITKPADLKGLRIRTIGNEICTQSIAAMGAVPTPMDWSEVYQSIQQKALDGCEAQTVSLYTARMYEVATHISKTGHFELVACEIMGKKFFDSLKPEHQTLFMETAKTVGSEYQEKVIVDAAAMEKDMIAKGIVITEVDKAPFVAAVQPVYEKLGFSEIKETLLNQIK